MTCGGTASDATARAAIETRIMKYAQNEIKFNLMAIVRDKRAVLEEQKLGADAAALADIEAELAMETAKRSAWAQENVRRHHNYIPLVVDLFKVLAEKGKLQAMIDDAKKQGADAAASKRQKA